MGTPIKLTTPDGFTFELDSLDQAVALKHRLGSSKTAAPRRQSSSQRSAPIRGVADSEISGPTRSFLDAVWKAPAGLNTTQVSSAIGVSAKSVPPILRTLNRWCETRRLKLGDLIERKPQYVNRKPVTLYQMTELGKKAFRDILIDHQLNGMKPKEETL